RAAPGRSEPWQCSLLPERKQAREDAVPGRFWISLAGDAIGGSRGFSRCGGTRAAADGVAGFERADRYCGFPADSRASRSWRSVGKETYGSDHAATANPAIPRQPGAKKIHHAGEPGAENFSCNAHTVEAAVRSVVAGGEKRAGSRTDLQRVRTDGNRVCGAVAATEYDRRGCGGASR